MSIKNPDLIAGRQPESFIHVHNRKEAFEYSHDKFRCFDCGFKVHHHLAGFVHLVRKQRGNYNFFEVHAIVCGHCNTVNNLFYNDFWLTNPQDLIQPIVNSADGWYVIYAEGADPDQWLPDQYFTGWVNPENIDNLLITTFDARNPHKGLYIALPSSISYTGKAVNNPHMRHYGFSSTTHPPHLKAIAVYLINFWIYTAILVSMEMTIFEGYDMDELINYDLVFYGLFLPLVAWFIGYIVCFNRIVKNPNEDHNAFYWIGILFCVLVAIPAYCIAYQIYKKN